MGNILQSHFSLFEQWNVPRDVNPFPSLSSQLSDKRHDHLVRPVIMVVDSETRADSSLAAGVPVHIPKSKTKSSTQQKFDTAPPSIGSRNISPANNFCTQHKYICNRDTNITGVGNQAVGDCYAHAAVSAYINTCNRIYGCKPPEYAECLPIAAYNNGDGGQTSKALAALEEHFKRGVRWCTQSTKPTIRQVIVTSVIMSFTTNSWSDISRDSLSHAPGKDKSWHACLIESYNWETKMFRVKNSWGMSGQNGRFESNLSDVICRDFTRVYFTEESIANCGYPTFKPKVIRLRGNVFVDETTARYSSEFVYVQLDEVIERNGIKYTHKAWPVDEYIRLRTESPRSSL